MPTTTHPMLLFVDTETTGLDPDDHAIWEVAAIRYDPAERQVLGEYVWQLPLTPVALELADPEALKAFPPEAGERGTPVEVRP